MAEREKRRETARFRVELSSLNQSVEEILRGGQTGRNGRGGKTSKERNTESVGEEGWLGQVLCLVPRAHTPTLLRKWEKLLRLRGVARASVGEYRRPIKHLYIISVPPTSLVFLCLSACLAITKSLAVSLIFILAPYT